MKPELSFETNWLCLYLLPFVLISRMEDDEGADIGTGIIFGFLFWQLGLMFVEGDAS